MLLIVGGLVAERLWLTAAHLGAADRLARAERLAGELLLADLRLTAAAQMAVATGARRWVDAYDQHLLELDHALAHARAMAPPAAAERFDAQTREANDELAGMRESAFEAVNVGAVDVARIIFEGQRYRAHTQLLGAATAEFTAAVVQSTEAERAGLERRALMVGTAALLAAVLMGAALWSQVGARLKHWRGFYLDAEARTQRLASSDLLTGLANRAALHDAMTAAMARAAREGRGLALLMIDLDRFKPVNDRHGHLIGDRVLKEVAQRLGQCLRAGEVRARYGGDEFVVLIDELDDPTATMVAARRIVQVLGEGMVIDALMLSVGASIGIARYPDDAHTEDELLRRADSALYRAKASHRGGVCFYDAELDGQVAERADLEQAIRDGILRGEFVPHYQPIVALDSGVVQSLEVLCRWNHPRRGLLAPAHFIALAEDSGLVGLMTLALLRRACNDLRQFPAHWRLAINLAPQLMLDSTLVPQLLKLLDDSGVAPERLDVELTESALVSDTGQARRVMQALMDAGITVTLDDFGTGYSSLSYLAELRFDKIKIDRSFVRALNDRPESAKIVHAIMGLSRSLGVAAVAEGVETERDVRLLQELGCGFGQGYWFSRPVPAEGVLMAAKAAALKAVPVAATCKPSGDTSAEGLAGPWMGDLGRYAKQPDANGGG